MSYSNVEEKEMERRGAENAELIQLVVLYGLCVARDDNPKRGWHELYDLYFRAALSGVAIRLVG